MIPVKLVVKDKHKGRVYCEVRRVQNDNALVVATLDYCLDRAIANGWCITNAQEILEWLAENKRINYEV